MNFVTIKFTDKAPILRTTERKLVILFRTKLGRYRLMTMGQKGRSPTFVHYFQRSEFPVDGLDLVQIQQTMSKILRLLLSQNHPVAHSWLRSKFNQSSASKQVLEIALYHLLNQNLIYRHAQGGFPLYEVPAEATHQAEAIAFAEFPVDDTTRKAVAFSKLCTRPSSFMTSTRRLPSPRGGGRKNLAEKNLYSNASARKSITTGKRGVSSDMSISAHLAKKIKFTLESPAEMSP